MQLGTLFVPYLEKGSLHVQEPKNVPYITKNYSKEPKKILKMVLKTPLEPFSEHLKVPPVGQPKKTFFSKSAVIAFTYCGKYAVPFLWATL